MVVVLLELAIELGREELFGQGLHDGEVEDLVAGRTVARRNLQHELDDSCHLLAEVVGNAREFALDDLLVEALHVVRSERRDQGTHLVENAAEGPDVTFAVVGLVAPNLGTCVVGRTRLRIAQAFFDDLTDIKISQLRLHVFEEEQIRTLHVAMEDASDVECAESADNLYEHIPDLLFLDVGLSLLIVANFLEHVTVVGVLHHKAQARGRLVNKSVPIRNHVRMVDRGKNSNLV